MHRSDKVILDTELVNKMRLTHTDTEIIKFFKTSTKNFTNQCKKRWECWINSSRKWTTYNKYNIKPPNPQSRKKIKIDKWLMKEKHPEIIKDNYWEKWEIIKIWENPVPFISLYIK